MCTHVAFACGCIFVTAYDYLLNSSIYFLNINFVVVRVCVLTWHLHVVAYLYVCVYLHCVMCVCCNIFPVYACAPVWKNSYSRHWSLN